MSVYTLCLVGILLLGLAEAQHQTVLNFCTYDHSANEMLNTSDILYLGFNSRGPASCECRLKPVLDMRQNRLYPIYVTARLAKEKTGSDEGRCPPRLDMSPSNATFYVCPRNRSAAPVSTQFAVDGGGELTMRLHNPSDGMLDGGITLTVGYGVLRNYMMSCGPVEHEKPEKECPCSEGWHNPDHFFTEEFDARMRLMTGLLCAFFFLVIVGIIVLIFWLRRRRLARKQQASPQTDGAVNHTYSVPSLAPSLAASDKPDPMYAEIGGPARLPFTPDPALQLGLQKPYAGSTDSGLYSEAPEGTLAGHGALMGASIISLSNASLHSSLQDAHAPPTPSKQDIEALYAKPNKVRGKQPQPAQPQAPTPELYRPEVPPHINMLPSGGVPPPLATGSRSSSHNNLYGDQPAPLAHDISVGELYMTDNTHTVSSQNSLNVSRGTMETDV